MRELTEKEEWRGRPLEIRQRYMAQEIFVAHPSLVRIVGEIKRLSRRCRNERKGLAFLVLAGSGGGKTYLTHLIQKRWPADHTGEISQVPVVSFSIPPSPTQKSMGSELLRALGGAKWKSGSALELFDRALKQLREVQTTIIFIDNVHDIPERRRAGGIIQLGNWIRDLIDGSQCLVVLLGTPAAKQITEANAQLRRRVTRVLTMPYFDVSSAGAQARFLRFLSELDKELPLAEMSNLADLVLAKKLYWATYGIHDYIFQLLTEALAFAIREKRERIIEADLQQAFDTLFRDGIQPGCNPFAADGPTRPLDQEGEPFHNWFDSSNPRPEAK